MCLVVIPRDKPNAIAAWYVFPVARTKFNQRFWIFRPRLQGRCSLPDTIVALSGTFTCTYDPHASADARRV